MKRRTPSNFYNEGFGWVCRYCEEAKNESIKNTKSRLLSEGEAENSELSVSSIARWTTPEKNTLICPNCHLTETINI